ncbi:hypothetical protein B9Z65_5890 [Elsinoe australis]|uniref:Uncharacterized protein n=1 Tax=Elsinoe australis TaxID=40998 RepID=A0A2P7YJG5_9PEZI|nr:hypothetical protein B9Z65_5890 [Elsinoe australis]
MVTQAAAVPLFFSRSDPISLNLPSSPRTAMPETTHYNVYRVHIRHYSGTTNHEALALVASHREDQSAGRFYHVVSRGSLDRDWNQRTKFNFGAVQGVHRPKTAVQDREGVAGEMGGDCGGVDAAV